MDVGDKVQVDGMTGVVVAVISEGKYAAAYPESDWSYLEVGVLVKTVEAGLIHYPDLPMEVGQLVRVVSVPDELPNALTDDLAMRKLFQRCLGRVFSVVSVTSTGYVELEVGEVVGEAPYMHSIWLAPADVERVEADN